jgi:Domain of unknown function (DUF4062)
MEADSSNDDFRWDEKAYHRQRSQMAQYEAFITIAWVSNHAKLKSGNVGTGSCPHFGTMDGADMNVYLSSTYLDLQRHRKSLAIALRKAQYQVTMMEEYAARDEMVEFACQGDVAECDAYVGVFAWRYGYVPKGKGNPKRVSVTELEYATARRKKIPALLFLLKDDAKWPKDLKDKNLIHIHKLRGRLKSRCAAYFTDRKELALEVLAALRVLESTRFAKQLEAINVIQKAQELGPSYLMNIQKKLGALGEAPLIEFQIGQTPWWNTRLYLVAALAHDMGGAREFVFVDAQRRFLTMAPPAEIRDRLARRWPALEKAYVAFRNEAATFGAVEQSLWRYPMAVAASFEKDEQSAKEDVTAHDLEREFGIACDAETVDVADKGQVFLQREILGRAAPFAALIRRGRLEGLVERQELARRVADKALAQLA